MRNLQLLVILVLIIFAISLIQKEGLDSKQTPTPTPIQSGPIETPAPSPTPNLLPPTPTSIPSPQRDMSSFIYPGSIILSQSGNEMTLQSTDDPQTITNWYKEKITSLGMNAKSFVISIIEIINLRLGGVFT